MSQIYDIGIIGGGVVGCAILHELTISGYHCILLEKEDSLITGASSGNSGIYASGFDASRNTLEGRCLSRAAALNERIFKQYALLRGKPGAIIIARNSDEVSKLPTLLKEAHDAGETGCRLLNKGEIRQMEPNISETIEGGMWVPRECAFEPWLLPITLAHVAKKYGAKVATNHEVVGATFSSDSIWEVDTNKQKVFAKTIINAAGLLGDKVESFQAPSPFRIKPRLGEYVVYDKDARHLVNHILMPVPSDLGRGIIVFPSVHGNLIVGPTAVDVDNHNVEPVPDSTVSALKAYAEYIVPGLDNHQIIGTYAGLRPATQYLDYQIKHHPDRNWVTVGGIRSTGASASIAIASYVRYLVQIALQQEPSSMPRPKPPAIAWKVQDNGTLLMDQTLYKITHPITKFGLDNKSKSKL